MDWLKQIAPTIATAMGGPLAGMAVSAISKAIGVDPDKVGDLISNNKLTAEQIAQVKIAEIELQKQAQELGLNFEKLSVEDRKSARDMQAATRSIVPPALAAIITVGFFSILIMMMLGKVDGNNPTILMMLGSLLKVFGRWCALSARLLHCLARTSFDALAFGMNVCVQSF